MNRYAYPVYAAPNMVPAAAAPPQYWSPKNSPRTARNPGVPVASAAQPVYRPPGAPAAAYPMNYYPAMPAYGAMGAGPGFAYGQPFVTPAAVIQPGKKAGPVAAANGNSNDPRKLLASNPDAFDALNDKTTRVKLTKKYIVKMDPSALKDDDDDDDDYMDQFNVNPPMNNYIMPARPVVHHRSAHWRPPSVESYCSKCEESCPHCRQEKSRYDCEECCPDWNSHSNIRRR